MRWKEALVPIRAGVGLQCPHCPAGLRSFRTKKVTVVGRWLQMFDLEGAGEPAVTFICVNCGSVQTFVNAYGLRRPR